jgi:hypothetical protein
MDATQPSETQRHMNADTLLQASRRLDWRFLLPDSTLRRVAYVGKTQVALLESLQIFSDRLDVWETNSLTQDSRAQALGAYDVVVAHDPTYAALQQGVALTGSGGYLYVEARSLLAFGRRRFSSASWFTLRPRLWSLTDYIRTLKQLGMDTIAAFWLWPTLEACTKFIPVDDLATFARFQLSSLRPPLLQYLLRSKVIQHVAGSRLVHDAIPCFGIVAYQARHG